MSALLRHVPPVPEGFARRFVSGGWREVERIYGARTDLLIKWIEMSGGDELHALRRAHMRGKCAGGNPQPETGLEAAA